MTSFPSPEAVGEALAAHASVAAAARYLGIPARTLQEHVQKGRYSADTASDTSFVEEIPVIVRDYSHLDHLYVYPLGDVHIGAMKHDRVRWEEWLEYLEGNGNTSLLGTGDFLNAGIIGSKSEVYDEQYTVGGAKRRLIEDLRPLATQGRIDALAVGNHEERVFRAIGDCPIEDTCDRLELPYVKHAAMILYLVGDRSYEVYLRHGTGNGQHLAQLAKSASVAHADVYVTGHTHRQAATADEFFVREGRRMKRRRRYFVSSGSFLAYEGYAAARGYTPSRLGAPRVYLNGERHDVHVSI
jgi:predicted phosphodiesterase